MKHFMFMPIRNRADLAKKALKSVYNYQGEIFIIDSTPKGLGLVFQGYPVVRMQPNTYFNQIQEMMRLYAIKNKFDYYFFLHNDAIVEDGGIEKIEKLAKQRNNWGLILTNHDTLCAIKTRATKKVGEWDRFLTWYYSDIDYHRRIELAGYDIVQSDIKVKHLNGASSTLKSDKVIADYVHRTFPLFREYYCDKWGGDKGQEKFEHPFNISR